MMGLPVGIVSLLAVIFYAVHHGNIAELINIHSFVIVVFGTAGIFIVTTPSGTVANVVRALRALWRHQNSDQKLSKTLIELSRNRKANASKVHPLIDYAKNLWEEGVDKKVFEELLGQKMNELNASTQDAVTALKGLAKYPPALGMTGTVLGIVSLFSKLTPESRNMVGPTLALAMTATLYGLVLANFFLLPLADRVQSMHLQMVRSNDHVFNVLILIHQEEAETLIKAELNAA